MFSTSFQLKILWYENLNPITFIRIPDETINSPAHKNVMYYRTIFVVEFFNNTGLVHISIFSTSSLSSSYNVEEFFPNSMAWKIEK